jgi:hypothetical protein
MNNELKSKLEWRNGYITMQRDLAAADRCRQALDSIFVIDQTDSSTPLGMTDARQL